MQKDFDRWFQELNNASSRTSVVYIVNSFMSYYNLNWFPGNAFEETAKIFEDHEWKEVALFLKEADHKISQFPTYDLQENL